MKSLKFLLYITCISFSIVACYKEDPIIPSDSGNSERFIFPQGDKEQDLVIKKIHDDFGVKIIYKDFKRNDFSITWTSPAGGRVGSDLAENHQKVGIDFIANHIFGNLTPEITKKVLPPYYYLADSIADYTLYPGILETYTASLYVYNGLDFWAFSWDGFAGYTKYLATGEIVKKVIPTPPTTPFSIFYKRGVILKEIFKAAVNNGNISIPKDFNTGFDFTTAISTVASDANYHYKRGFPGQFSSTINFNNSVLSRINATSEKQNFIDYIHLCMRYTPDSIEARYPKAQYPIIHAKYPIVIDYMKNNYNIDLNKIATKPQV